MIAETVAQEVHQAREQAPPQHLVSAAASSTGHLWRRQLGIARRAAGEAALLTVDPLRAKDLAEAVVGTVRGTVEEYAVAQGQTSRADHHCGGPGLGAGISSHCGWRSMTPKQRARPWAAP